MQRTRFISTSKLVLLLALAGFTLGCGGPGGSTPVPTKEESKRIGAEMKRSMLEQKAARQAAKGGRP